MCGRYVRRSTRKLLAQHFHLNEDAIPELGASYYR